MKKSFIRLPLIFAAATTLNVGELKAADSAPKEPKGVTTAVDNHAEDRQKLIDAYIDLNLDFEGDFPALYWDHGEQKNKGHVAGPGGVRLDGYHSLTVYKITPLDNRSICVKSYRKKDKEVMASMAKGIVPKKYKGRVKIEQVTIDPSKLKQKDIPDRTDSSFSKSVYFVPPAQRAIFHKQAIEKHIRLAETIFGTDFFYSLPIARQAVVTDMVYLFGHKIKGTKFAKAILAKDWNGPNAEEPKFTNKEIARREACTAKGRNQRRHRACDMLLAYGMDTLSLKNIPVIKSDIVQFLPEGETALAERTLNVLSVNARINDERSQLTTIALNNSKKGLKK